MPVSVAVTRFSSAPGMDTSSNSNTSNSTSVATTAPNTVYVSAVPHGAIIPAGSKMAQSVIQQNQASVIQSPTALQTVQVAKGNEVILLKGPANSVIQTAAGQGLQGVQVVEASTADDGDRKNQRQILVRRPSYRKILNELERSDGGGNSGGNSGGSSDSSTTTHEAVTTIPTTTLTIGGQEFATASLLKVIPAGSLQLTTSGADALQTIAMSSAAATPGTILQYNTGSDATTQFIVPVGGGDLSSLKFSSAGGITQGVVLTTPPSTVATSTAGGNMHSPGEGIGEEANRKREVRLLKNREAARECRAKKKEYIKCLENRVAVLENQNKALIEELKTLKQLYCQGS